MRRWIITLILAGLVLQACGGSGGETSSGPAVGSSCDTLGSMECSKYDGKSVVVFCKIDDKTSNQIWSVVKVCTQGCADGACVVQGKDVGEDDGATPDVRDDTVNPDAGADSTDVAADANNDAADTRSDGPCVPDCGLRVCGDDGCGGSCGDCAGSQVCLPDGSDCCTPDCLGRLCGDNGCGGTCGDCDPGWVCSLIFQCIPECKPKCEDRECGPDTCGGFCGTCPAGKACGPQGKCTVCVPTCEGKECGDDGCGGQCGGCAFGYECKSNKCEKACLPICANKDCGDDGCGGSCGECYEDEQCVNNQCLMVCMPDCNGKDCGPDGCGGSCGKCAPWQFCTTAGACVNECLPQCLGRICGPDGCGSTCGSCLSGSFCNEAGMCLEVGGPCSGLGVTGWCDGDTLVSCAGGMVQATDCATIGKNVVCEWMPALGAYGCNPHGECVPNCSGKFCGDDGCGGSCGSCQVGQTCELGQCVGQGECGSVSYFGCCSGDTVLWCDEQKLWFMDCTKMQDPAMRKCGWNASLGFYDCLNDNIAGPPEHPFFCGGACVPSCIDRQCGDDGCGGSCGTCPVGLNCVNNHCVGTGGGCGGYTASPVCQGDQVVWCEDDHVMFINCPNLGLHYKCGWVADLFVYGCYEEECIPQCDKKECGDDGCGSVCGYCPVTQYCNDIGQCMFGSGLCGDIDYIGVCEGNVVKWCQNGVLQTFDCVDLGPTYNCGWFESGGYWWCIN